MDEYTFIVLAKLEADRRKLEREQPAMTPQHEQLDGGNNRPEYLRPSNWFSRGSVWRDQP